MRCSNCGTSIPLIGGSECSYCGIDKFSDQLSSAASGLFGIIGGTAGWYIDEVPAMLIGALIGAFVGHFLAQLVDKAGQ